MRLMRVVLVSVLALGLLGAPLAVAAAQPPGKVPRVGCLNPGSPSDPLNMRTAKALGLTFPPSIAARIDHVIE